MSPDWDIGDLGPDGKAISVLAASICELAGELVTATGLAPRWEFPRQTSFRARCEVRPDPGLKPRSQLFVYFAAARGPWPRTYWSLQVRRLPEGPNERRSDEISERFARAFRTMYRPEHVDSTYKNIRRLAMKSRSSALPALSRDVPGRMRRSFLWVNPRPNGRDREDLIAQVVLFLLQTNLLHQSSRDHIERWLLWHLEERFKLDDVEASQTLIELRRYVRPPSATSWTAYVRVCVRWIPARRAARGWHPRDDETGTANGAREGSAGEKGVDQAPFQQHYEEETRADAKIRPKSLRSVIGSGMPDLFTVDDAAEDLGVSRSLLYDWIKKKKISTVTAEIDRRKYITRAEIEHVRPLCPRSPKAAIEAWKQATGASDEASRKAVWRKLQAGVKLETLVDDLRAQLARPRLVKRSRKSTDK